MLPKVLVGAAIGIVVLALVVGGGLYWNHLQRLEAERVAAEQARTELEHQSTAARAVVTEFFGSLAAGDVEGALNHAVTRPEGPLLTADVVKAAVKAGPVTALSVEPAKVVRDASGGFPTATVRSSWKVGATAVSKVWALTRKGPDWKLDRVTATVRLAPALVPYKINNVAVTGSSVEVLPGTYTVTPQVPAFTFTSPTFTVTEPAKAVSWETGAAPTAAALDQARQALATSYQNCLKQTSRLRTENCPFGWNDEPGITVDPGSVRLTGTGDPLAGKDFVHSAGTSWMIDTVVTVALKATGRQGSTRWNLSAPPTRFRAYGFVDLVSKQVRWEYSRL